MRQLSGSFSSIALHSVVSEFLDMNAESLEQTPRKRDEATIFFEHRLTDNEFQLLCDAAVASHDDKFFAIGGLVGLPKNEQVSDIIEFVPNYDYALYKREISWTGTKNLPFYQIYDNYSVLSPSKTWIGYVDNRRDVGFLSAFTEEMAVFIANQVRTCDIVLSLTELNEHYAKNLRRKLDLKQLQSKLNILQPEQPR